MICHSARSNLFIYELREIILNGHSRLHFLLHRLTSRVGLLHLLEVLLRGLLYLYRVLLVIRIDILRRRTILYHGRGPTKQIGGGVGTLRSPEHVLALFIAGAI